MSSTFVLYFNWSVNEDQRNSDHFPIIIQDNTFSTVNHNLKWKFNTLCTGKLIPEDFKESSDPISGFTSSLIEISKKMYSSNFDKSN